MIYQNLEVTVSDSDERDMLLDMFDRVKHRFAALKIVSDSSEMVYQIKASYGPTNVVAFDDAIAILAHIEEKGLYKIEREQL